VGAFSKLAVSLVLSQLGADFLGLSAMRGLSFAFLLQAPAAISLSEKIARQPPARSVTTTELGAS
jgi:hypothetical protein